MRLYCSTWVVLSLHIYDRGTDIYMALVHLWRQRRCMARICPLQRKLPQDPHGAYVLSSLDFLYVIIKIFIHPRTDEGAVFVLGTIGIRIGTFFTAAGPAASSSHTIIRVLNIFQIGTLVWSLATNMSATLIISHKAWCVQQDIIYCAALILSPGSTDRLLRMASGISVEPRKPNGSLPSLLSRA